MVLTSKGKGCRALRVEHICVVRTRFCPALFIEERKPYARPRTFTSTVPQLLVVLVRVGWRVKMPPLLLPSLLWSRGELLGVQRA